MKKTTHEGRTHLAIRPRTSLILLIAAWAICGTSYAQTVIGSSGAGFQTWNTSDLNDNDAPFWDTQFGGSQPNSEGSPAEKNVGFCLTSSGDCQGIGSALFAPGTLPFWGMPYNSATDTGGALDPKVYFKAAAVSTSSSTKTATTSGGTGGTGMQSLKATLYLNSSANPIEINEFGWFETNATGSVIGNRHMLFQGSGVPTGTLTPDPVGSTRTFTPTQYFGYYYSDVSEGGCFAYTLFNFNDPNCFGSHNFAVFSTSPGSSRATYWIAGEDPQECLNNDGDCNVTLVKVSALGE